MTGHEKVASAKQVKYYHVVVITSLPFYKRAEHSEEDTVQFMVRYLPACACCMVNVHAFVQVIGAIHTYVVI